jgi:uncharacterized membrane protein
MRRWLLYCLLTVLCFGVWGVSFKALDPYGVTAGRSQALSTLGIVPILLVLAASPGWRGGERRRRGSVWAFVAGVLVGLGNLAYYHAQAEGGKVASVVSLSMLYPAVTVVLALLLLRERPGAVQAVGIALSLAAIYQLAGVEHEGALSGWLVYALAPIALWGVSGYVQKVATGDVPAELATFWFLAAFIPLACVLYAVERFGWDLPARAWLLVVLQGATYGLGNLCLLAAFRSGGKASVVTPLSGLYPVVTIPLAIAFLGESVGRREWVGVAFALAAGTALAIEPRRGPAESPAAPAPTP